MVSRFWFAANAARYHCKVNSQRRVTSTGISNLRLLQRVCDIEMTVFVVAFVLMYVIDQEKEATMSEPLQALEKDRSEVLRQMSQ